MNCFLTLHPIFIQRLHGGFILQRRYWKFQPCISDQEEAAPTFVKPRTTPESMKGRTRNLFRKKAELLNTIELASSKHVVKGMVLLDLERGVIIPKRGGVIFGRHSEEVNRQKFEEVDKYRCTWCLKFFLQGACFSCSIFFLYTSLSPLVDASVATSRSGLGCPP